jgi:hypothetical protein
MPGTPKPVVDPRFGPAWTPVLQNAQANKQQAAALNSGAAQGNLLDQYGNTIQVSGSDLNQIVTIGATFGQSGVQVSTGLPSGTAGLAVQSGPTTTTITLTQGSIAATVGAVAGALAVGQVIGAANVSDPSSGTATPAITPGTTIAAVSGSSVTLSQGAAESGTSLFCAASRFILQQDSGWVLLTSFASGISAGNPAPAYRLVGDRVQISGFAISSISGPGNLVQLPNAIMPLTTSARFFPCVYSNSWAVAAVTGGTPNWLGLASGGAISGTSAADLSNIYWYLGR